jgi:hypothetical protein
MQPSATAPSGLAPASAPTALTDRRTEKDLIWLVYSYVACAAAWLAIGTAIGLYVAIKFVWPDFGIASWLSEPRLRPVHTSRRYDVPHVAQRRPGICLDL